MPKKYIIELEEQDFQVINAALDTHVRQHGIQVVTQAAVLMARINDQILAKAKAQPLAEDAVTPQ